LNKPWLDWEYVVLFFVADRISLLSNLGASAYIR